MPVDWTQLAVQALPTAGAVLWSYVSIRERLIRLEERVQPLTKNGLQRRVTQLETQMAVYKAKTE